jgi:hypothetical protein
MTMQKKRCTESQAWTLVGYSIAMMSVFAARHGVWRNVVSALAAVVLATALARARTRCVR